MTNGAPDVIIDNMLSERKQQIIDVTRSLLAEEGPSGVTMRRIAGEVGVSEPALYRHFKDRNAIIRAVVEQAGELFGSYLFRALEYQGPVDQLAAAGEQYLLFAFEHAVEFNMIFGLWGELSAAEIGVKTGPDCVSPNLQFLIDRIAACAPGTPRERLLELAIEQWALVHGLATLYLHAGGSQMMTREQYNVMCSRIVRRSAEWLAARGARSGSEHESKEQ